MSEEDTFPSSALSPVPSSFDRDGSMEKEELTRLDLSDSGNPPVAFLTIEPSDKDVPVHSSPPLTPNVPAVDLQDHTLETIEAKSVASPASITSPSTEDQLGAEPALLSVRSTRKRKAPTRFIEDVETRCKAPKASKTPTKVPARAPAPAPTPAPTRRKVQPQRGNWSPHYLLSNANSKLANYNLSDLLNNEKAWSILSRDEQLELISMLPGASAPDIPEDTALPNVLKQHLKSNSSFQADVRLFQEDLAAGRYDPKWLEDAQNAMSKRAKGHFDDWKENNRELFWGQKQRVDWTALAGESSQHSLQTLVGAGYFMVGDVWLFRRGFRGDGSAFTVEKEAVITHVTPDNLLTFTFPPGHHKLSSPINGTDIVLQSVNGPAPLSNAIIAEDGRLVGVRGANAWREYRCFRRNQDMGSLWDVRELYHRRNSVLKEK